MRLIESSLYHYTPTEYVCVLFVSLFGLSTLIHAGQMVRYRMWWLIPTVLLAGVAEIIGWSARLWSSQNPVLKMPYVIQITTTIIAPTPLVAANFLILGAVIRRLGVQYSRLSPKWYTIVFCTFDVVSLVAQAVGGAMASAALTPVVAEKGAHIMLGGIVFQMFSITVYVLFAMEYFWRYFSDKPLSHKAALAEDETRSAPDKGVKIMMAALSFDTLCIFIRAVYRTIELANGWTGHVIETQVYFNACDGAMIVLAIYTLNFFHPGRLLNEPTRLGHDAVQPEKGAV
ncbi:RTA1-like protein [Athelia psychrophila]|uniref:RTA1-like protein n=1 Tax=Athelia psychrophila TaxID=1759441 RepID=A0A166U729_9AGAM|nr:RTA1-like protein [Fibularhizoctonia sp. CBS 109695]